MRIKPKLPPHAIPTHNIHTQTRTGLFMPARPRPHINTRPHTLPATQNNFTAQMNPFKYIQYL